MSNTIEFVFDFGSPNAYLAWRVLPGVLERTGASLALTPVLLGGVFKSTGNQPPMMTFSGIPAKLNYMRVEMMRFVKRHRLTAFKMNPHFPVNTVLMMRGAIQAQAGGTLERYTEAGMAAMWEQGLKMDDPTVFAEAMTAAGLDGQALVEGAQDATVKQALIDATAAAVGRGVFGAPTFFAGDEMYFGKDGLMELASDLEATA